MLRSADVALGEGRAVACARCGAAAPATYAPDDTVRERIAEAIAAWTGPGAANISLGGPEPFNHPALPGIVAYAVDAGVARLAVVTDGAALAAGENAAGSQAAGVTHARVVLLGPRSLHDALAARPGAFDRALAGMRAWETAARAGSRATFLSGLVPVCEHNLREAHATVAELARAGAREVVLDVDPALDAGTALPWLAAACDTGTVNRAWVRVRGVEAEALGGHSLHAASEMPCEATP